MRTKFLPFGLAGDLVNPDEVYKISRVTDTVTLTLRVVGMGAGSVFSEDFVFGSEQDAIDAVDEFVAAADFDEFTFSEALEAVVTGSYANPEATKGAFSNTNLGTIEDRVDVFNITLIIAALDLKIKYDAAA